MINATGAWSNSVVHGCPSCRRPESLAQSEIHYERLLALMSASGSCAEDLIVTMLADPSPMLASRAARLAARACPMRY